MSVVLDLSKTPEESFYDLLTKSTTALPSGSALTSADLTYSALTIVSGRDDGHNTSILLTPVSSSTLVYGDAKTVFYTRKDIAGLGVTTAITDDIDNWATGTATASALAYLQANMSSSLTGDAIVVSAPVTNEDNTVNVAVTIADGHLVLFGTLTLVITPAETRTSTDEIPESQDGFDESGS